MDKYKYFLVESQISFLEICTILKSIDSDEQSELFGFRTISLSKTKSTFQFYEKKYLETELTTIEGIKQTIHYVNIDSFEFTIHSIDDKKLHLIIKNPNRNISYFKQKLGEILRYKISIVSIKVNPVEWLETVESNLQVNFNAISIEIRNINLDGKISANIVFKGTEDIRHSYYNYIQSKYFDVAKVLSMGKGFFTGKLILCNDASMHLDITNEQKLIELLVDFLKP